MNVSDIMTAAPVTVDAGASLEEAMRLMDEHDVRHLPVLRGAELLGVISDRDLLGATGWQPASMRAPGGPETVGELVQSRPVTATPDDTVVMMAVDMVSREIGCLPVLSEGALVGIVTEMDLLESYIGISHSNESSLALHAPTQDLMSTRISSLGPEATLGEALELTEARHVRHLPVVEEERVVGILSDRDLRRATARDHGPETPVRELMSRDPLTVDPEEPLSRAAACLFEARISSLPVVDDGRLVGILTLGDLLDYCIVNLRSPDKR